METLPEKFDKKSHNCQRCGNKFGKKLLFFDEKAFCFVCKREVCDNCLAPEERYSADLKRQGKVCLDCVKVTRVTSQRIPYLPTSFDFSSAFRSISITIPDRLELIREKLNHLPKVEAALLDLDKTLIDQFKDVKEFSQGFTIRNWRRIKNDVYQIIILSLLGIYFVGVFIMLEIILLMKYFYPLI